MKTNLLVFALLFAQFLIQPKCGFLPELSCVSPANEIKTRVTRFQMHQHLKLSKNEVIFCLIFCWAGCQLMMAMSPINMCGNMCVLVVWLRSKNWASTILWIFFLVSPSEFSRPWKACISHLKTILEFSRMESCSVSIHYQKLRMNQGMMGSEALPQ